MFAGLLIGGSFDLISSRSASAEAPVSAAAPLQLQLKADRQYRDQGRNLTVAEGNVSVQLGASRLQADRVEFDSDFKTIHARGAVRLTRGAQTFQASALRYNIVQQEGELDDVYGVIDLTGETSSEPEPFTAAAPQPAELACTPLLPPVPDWHPQPWSVTAWGGQMIDAAFGDTFLFKGDMRPEAVLGIGLQRRIWRAGPLAVELEADLFSHIAQQQRGGEYNQSTPYADLAAQTFGEGVVGIGARLWLQPWLSFSVLEGVSYNSQVSLYEKTFRENYSKLLNYLGIELEAAVSPDVSVVGRIHHRSGAFGTYNGVTEGSNAYLLGLRYRWGRDRELNTAITMPPPEGCPDPDRDQRVRATSLNERLESVSLGDGGSPVAHVNPAAVTAESPLSAKEQQQRRNEAIAAIDQRIDSVALRGTFSIERRSGVPLRRLNSSVRDENRFGVVKVPQLKRLGSTQLINGSISRWRVQADRITLEANGWRAERMGFSNDPFTPAQTRIDAEGVIARDQPNGDLLISARRNRLIVEDSLPIPVSRRQLIQKEEEVENRWVLGIDNDDRDGLFLGRTLKPIGLGASTELSLEPQLMLQRAIDAGSGSSPDDAGDLFGLEAKLLGRYDNVRLRAEADISSFSGVDFLDNSRYWGSVGRSFQLGRLGEVKTNLFGAHRYRTWNGSLGSTDIQGAYGLYGEKRGEWEDGDSRHSYLLRGAVGAYNSERYGDNALLHAGRASLFGSLTSTIPLWSGSTAELTPLAAYRYSPVAVVPGISLNTNVNATAAIYGSNSHQESLSFSGGPTLTLGTFSKPFLDFTQVSLIGGGTLRNGASPFEFDRIVDFGTMGIGVTQQIVGPLLLSTGVNLNVDPGSRYYGEMINSNIELRWQRRSYDLGVYFNPYEGVGGVRFRLNDFDFDGSGVPFVPYTPSDWFLGDRNDDGLPL